MDILINLETISKILDKEVFNFFGTVFTGLIALMSVFTYNSTRELWQQGNRPIISAMVETNKSGNKAITYDLTVINSGSRPATNIKLHLSNKESFQQCLTENKSSLSNSILRCFDENTVIPLLVNGEKISNSFGATSSESKDSTWKNGSAFDIKITYQDLEGKNYRSRVRLFIKDSQAFAGGKWENKSPITNNK